MNDKQIEDLILSVEKELENDFYFQEKIALINQKKVMNAFFNNKVALRHFTPSEGYGYDDIGRDTLSKIYAEIFETEAAIFSPNIVSGTHALTLALFGVLRPHDKMLSICSQPYDTLHDTILGKGIGSLKDFDIGYDQIELKNGCIDFDSLTKYLSTEKPKLIYVQRSRGYDWRDALSIENIKTVCDTVKKISSDTIIMVDNCYGEFIYEQEPTSVGADLCVGSLIKNIGGGLAPTGGYIAGKKKFIDLIANRMTSPSIGTEVGSYAYGYRLFYQGLFVAPHVVLQAKKSAMLFGGVFQKLGYDVLPQMHRNPNDIICSIKFNDKEKLLQFCKDIQFCSPVDSYLTPLPWAMPGYNDEVIMAAGCFVGGASIELSCDSPIRPPYIAYLQGALTYEHAKLALMQILKSY